MTYRFHQGQVTDEYDRPIPGAQIYVFDSVDRAATLTSDGVAPLAQPIPTDEFGVYTYWAQEGVYREDIYYGGKLRYRSLTAVGPVETNIFENAAIAADAAASVGGYRESLEASVAALAVLAGGHIVVDATIVVRPEAYGATGLVGNDATAAIRAAVGAAAVTGAVVQLTNGAVYTITSEIVVPAGIDIQGPRSASLRLKTQETALITGAGFTSGTGAKTFTVDDSTGFAVGMTVMFANTATHVVSPSDPFSHAGRQITAVAGNTITIGAGPSVSAHAAGDVMAATAHLLRLTGNNALRGFTVDGNEANNLYAHWITSAMIAQEGDGCRLIGLAIKNTPSDGFLCGGPNLGEIKGSWVLNCEFDNIGGNGCHYGNVRDIYVIGNRSKLGNARFALPVEQAGGANARLGHQDGFVSISDNVNNMTVAQNSVEDWICGVGGVSTFGAILNDNLNVVGNEFVNVFAPIEITIETRRVVFVGNICRSVYPFAAGAMRFNEQAILLDGSSGTNRVRDVIVSGNTIKNGRIYLDRVKGFLIVDNVIDNSEMITAGNAAGTLAAQRQCLGLFNFENGIVRGNITKGGFVSLWMQNGFAAGTVYCRDTIIEGNQFLNAYSWGLIESRGSTGTFKGCVLRGNIFRQDNAGTTEDGTALTFNVASWTGALTPKDADIQANRIAYNHGAGAAWSSTDAVTFASRRFNVVNDVPELLGNFANDAAAAVGNVAVGALYRNGSIVMERVA